MWALYLKAMKFLGAIFLVFSTLIVLPVILFKIFDPGVHNHSVQRQTASPIACETSCENLASQGQLKIGMTSHECIRTICGD